jgi:hypothetical protein
MYVTRHKAEISRCWPADVRGHSCTCTELVTILPITHPPACAVSAVSEHKHPALALVAAILTPEMK